MNSNYEDNEYGIEEIREIVNRFRTSLMSGRKKYFDVSEFEGIVDHLLEEGDLGTSEIAALQGMQIHPGATPLQLKYAQVLLNKGKLEEALTYIQKIEKIETNNADVYLIKGSAYLVMGFEQKALNAFEKALSVSTDDLDEIYYHIASAYIYSGDFENAIEYFEKVVELNPDNEVALGELGFFCEQTGDYEKSIYYYNKYLDIDPYNYYTWLNLGISYNLAGKFEDAISAFEYSLLLHEGFSQAIYNMANSYANLGKYDEAIAQYKEFLKRFPENDDACCNIGECYLNLEKYSKASTWYRKAVKIDKLNDSAWFGLALVKWIDSDFEAAKGLVLKALKIDNSIIDYWVTLAKIYNDSSKYTESLKCIRKAVKLEPGNPDVWLLWVETELKTGTILSAIEVLKNGIQKCDSVSLKYRLTGLYIDLNKVDDAMAMLQVALTQDFTSADLLIEFCPAVKKKKKIINEIRKFHPFF